MIVSLIQTDLNWESPRKNLEHFARLIEALPETDLIVLPEMFSTGFTMDPARVAEEMSGNSVAWMKSLARARNCAMTGSLVIQQHGKFYNRLVFVFPDGETAIYDKRHLFTLSGEDQVYFAGADKKIIEYKGWKICPQICYDLRFPVFSRNVEDYDLLIYVANWPKPRISAWDSLLKARAIENMSYVVGVNRIGIDGNGHEYPGHSQIIDYMGDHVSKPMSGNLVTTAELSKEPMLHAREKFGFLRDRDRFTVI